MQFQSVIYCRHCDKQWTFEQWLDADGEKCWYEHGFNDFMKHWVSLYE